MDPRQLFADERFRGSCVFCGRAAVTGDHVPPLILLDEPYPANLPIVPACLDCNNGFSLDEQYFACFLECVVSGTTEPAKLSRKVIQRTLTHSPALAARIQAAGKHSERLGPTWVPEIERLQTVALKLARGHAAFELSEPRLEPPDYLMCLPLPTLTGEQASAFLRSSSEGLVPWPEVGSRAFHRAIKARPSADDDLWQVVQQGRYRYFVDQADGVVVHFLVSEYLACRVVWQ